MRGRPGLAALAAGAAAWLLALAPAAGAAPPPPPADLEVRGGEETWHPDNGFRLYWVNPASAGLPIAAVHYRVRDASGGIAVSETRIGWATDRIDGLRVPGVPGVYTAEVWLEGAAGEEGAPAAVKLRFDDLRPGPVEPLPASAWIGRSGFPYTVRLAHPGGEPPASGIRGYAVAVDSSPDGEPCAAADRCTDAETDLRGGSGDDSLSIAALPEGTSFLHAVAVSGSGLKSATPGHTTLRVDKTDPVTGLSGAPSGWVNRPVALTATATDDGAGMEAGGGGPSPFTAIRIDGGTPSIAPGAAVGAAVIGEGVHTVAYYARDAAGNVNDGSASNGLPNRPPSTAAVRIDRSAPSVAFANSQDPRDPELIRVRVRDALAGPSPSRGWIGVRRAGSGDRFERLPTVAGADGLRARWNSDAYPTGEYEFRATGYDAAGNATSTAHRSNGTGMALSVPLKASTTLRAGFGGKLLVWHRCVRRGGRRRCRRETLRGFGRRPARRIVPYGRRTLFSGRLRAGLSAPLERMPVRVVERFGEGDDAVERATTVWTGRGGGFAIRLRAGPSREIVAAFAGTGTLARSASRTVRLGVRSGVWLRVSSTVARIGGRPLVFRGGVAAPRGAIPPGGKSVQLQFRLPGLPWSEFRTVRTDRRGRFRYAYRFSDDDSRGARFGFRAHLPAQSGWPYEPGSSRPVAVRGR